MFRAHIAQRPHCTHAPRRARAESPPTLGPDAKWNGARHVGSGCRWCAGAVPCVYARTRHAIRTGDERRLGCRHGSAARAAVAQAHNPEAHASGLADDMAEPPAMSA